MKIMSYFIDVEKKKKKKGATGIPIAEISWGIFRTSNYL